MAIKTPMTIPAVCFVSLIERSSSGLYDGVGVPVNLGEKLPLPVIEFEEETKDPEGTDGVG